MGVELEKDLEYLARRVGRKLDKVIKETSPNIGFILMMFEFGEDGFLTYISNANREDMTEVLKEWIERQGAK